MWKYDYERQMKVKKKRKREIAWGTWEGVTLVVGS